MSSLTGFYFLSFYFSLFFSFPFYFYNNKPLLFPPHPPTHTYLRLAVVVRYCGETVDLAIDQQAVGPIGFRANPVIAVWLLRREGIGWGFS
jgi:hypothetical protein